MNKTVSINISGIIFNIDELAYQKLSNYLNTIKSYFSDSEGRDEIMNDIEARVAEMFQQKLETQKKQVVSMLDVDEMISVMGEPEQYLTEDDEGDTNTSSSSRTFENNSTKSKSKRLFRDIDNNVIGGVCAGIGHYFNVDPVIIRVLLVLTFIFGGFGFILYVLFWVITPAAKTTAEKLEMKGENVNIDTIRKTVEEEADRIKKKISDLGNKAQEKVSSSNIPSQAESVFKRFFDFIFNAIGLFLNFFGKFIGIILLFAGVFALISLFTGLFTSSTIITAFTSEGFNSFSISEFSNLLFYNGISAWLAVASLILLCSVPIMVITYLGFKLLTGFRSRNRSAGITLLSLWLLGIILGGFVLFQTLSDFSSKSFTESNVMLVQPKGDTLKLKINEVAYPNNSGNLKIRRHNRSDNSIYSLQDGVISQGYPKVDIQESESDSFELVITKMARGESIKDSKSRASEIKYKFKQEGNSLFLDPIFQYQIENKWRKQEIYLTIMVPTGKSVYIDNNFERMLHDVDNISNTWDMDMGGYTWTMLSNGLACIGCFDDWEGEE